MTIIDNILISVYYNFILKNSVDFLEATIGTAVIHCWKKISYFDRLALLLNTVSQNKNKNRGFYCDKYTNNQRYYN